MFSDKLLDDLGQTWMALFKVIAHPAVRDGKGDQADPSYAGVLGARCLPC